jgi:hypothetical protein
METRDYKIEIEKWFEIGLNRSKINHISCINNKIKIENYTKEMVDEVITNEGRICPEILYFFNNIEDYTSNKIITQQNEIDAIRTAIIQSIEELDKVMIEALEEPGLLYELNEYFVEMYSKLGDTINEMNYESWIGLKNPNKNLDVLYLQVNGQQIGYDQFKLKIDYTDFQKIQFTRAFEERIHLLEQYRAYLTEVYARHLMLPSKKILPVIQYKEGSKMKIVELIYAIENENITIINTARFTQFMLQLFNISNQQYKKDCHEIRTRKENSIFLKELIKKLKEISQ